MKSTKANPDQPGETFATVTSLRLLADQLERDAVEHALNQGWSWAKIAEAMGISKQAAHKRHAHKQNRS